MDPVQVPVDAFQGKHARHQIQCRECLHVFSRVEHLRRHLSSHSAERSFRCTACHKGFYRIDALRRHEQIHVDHSRLNGGLRACFACASARRKCSGGIVCEACTKRSIQCNYPDRRATTGGSDYPESSQNRQYSGSEDSQSSIEDDRRNWSVVGNRQQEHTTNDSYRDVSADVLEQLPASSSSTASLQDEVDGEFSARDTAPDGWLQNSMSTVNWLFDDHTPNVQDAATNAIVLNSGYYSWDQSYTRPISHPSSIINILNPVTTDTVASGSHGQNLPRIANMTLPSSFNESRSASQTTKTTTGHYYVDGGGARLPHVKRRRTSVVNQLLSTVAVPQTTSPSDAGSHRFGFPDIAIKPSAKHLKYKQIKPSDYESILNLYHAVCTSTTYFTVYTSTKFPTLDTISHLVWLYFESFQPILPFIHAPTFDIHTSHWLLILAIASIGSHYVESVDIDFVVAMHELVRRGICYETENPMHEGPEALILTQIRLLSTIGMLYCGDKRFLGCLTSHYPLLISFCESDWLNTQSNSLQPLPDYERAESGWKHWCRLESLRRTGYCIWLLDCLSAIHFQMHPFLSLRHLSVPLPSQEVLWEAESLLDWQQLFECASPNPSLQTALQNIYIEKRLQPSIGEFSRILLIHALFRRTWEVEESVKQPLTQWTPTADRQDASILCSSKTPLWLPGNPMYAKWRNSACDCLDVLHWAANSVIGAMAGMEHHTVLHLHLARVILLTPFHDIVNLAKSISNSGIEDANFDRESTKKRVSLWATEDQYKARLAMIHAGVLFWHVRRYSTDAFYEPWSVWLATLALWAYSTFAKSATGEESRPRDTAGSESDEDALLQNSIQLDRPADDELVQLFVKKGAMMKALITGVGNLNGPRGPQKVVHQGLKLLAGLQHWDIGRTTMASLTKLAQVYSGQEQ